MCKSNKIIIKIIVWIQSNIIYHQIMNIVIIIHMFV